VVLDAIGDILPMAVVVALSPVPIIAIVLVLVGPRARSNGPLFVVGWLLGLGLVGGVVLLVAGPTDASDDGEPATWVAVLELALGALLLLLAAKQWRGRPRDGETPTMPKWMDAVDSFTPVKAFGIAVVLSGFNPKNLLLAIAAAAAISATGIPGGEQAIAYAVFAVIGTLGVLVPVVLYFVLGARAADPLERLKTWMTFHNAAIMSVLCLVIGAKVVGSGLADL
jgi:hypothetical protein